MKAFHNTTNRNSSIELLRFLFSLMIMSFHFGNVFSDSSSLRYASNGQIAVEFFFIVSGFLMAKSASKPATSKSIGTQTARFIGKKYFSIFPYHLFSYAGALIATAIVSAYTFRQIIVSVLSSLPNFFMIEMTGIESTYDNSFEWYISSMLIAMAIIYPLLRKNFSLTTKIIAPIAGVMLVGWLSHNFHTLSMPKSWLGYTFKGNIRAIAIICIGVTAYSVYQKIKGTNFTKLGQICLFAVEAAGYSATFLYAFTKKSEQYYFYLIFFIAVSVAITFSEKTASKKVKNTFFVFLGKLSLPLYLNQFYIRLIFIKCFPNLSTDEKSILAGIITIIVSVICLYAVKLLKKVNIKKLLIKEENE